MELRYHRVPPGMLRELASGRGGIPGVALLGDVQASRHTLLLRGVAELARELGRPSGAADRAGLAYALLSDLQAAAPDAVRHVIRHPSTGAWAGEAIRTALRDGSAAGLDRLGALAAAAAVRAGAAGAVTDPVDVTVPVGGGRLMLPSLGMAGLGPVPSATVRVSGGRAVIDAPGARVAVPPDPGRDGPGWLGLRRVRASSGGLSLDVLIDDLDPHRLPAVPVRGRLPEPEARLWRDDLAAAWRLLVRRHRGTAEEVGAGVRVVTPLAGRDSSRISASSREAPGGIAFSSTGDARALALVLAHESQHLKLAALLDVVPMLRPGHDRHYYAPWRDDPRPIYGLLQGAYAHLGVAGFWRRERQWSPGDLKAHTEFERWRAAALLACGSLLDGGGLTPAGADFVLGMSATLRLWAREPVPLPAVLLARRKAGLHRDRWTERNGRLPLPG